MYEELKTAVVDGDEEKAEQELNSVLGGDADPVDIVMNTLIPSMNEVADLWQSGDYFMSDVILSANAFSKCMDIITPVLEKSDYKPYGKFMIGVVEGDMHDLGKNIVAAMLRANGFEVIDLGVNVPTEKFVEAVREKKPDILGIGAYMSTTMGLLKEVIDAVEAAGLREGMKITVGGVCVTESAAEAAGADAYGGDAMHTVELAKEYLGVEE